jgi:hypothetical protein
MQSRTAARRAAAVLAATALSLTAAACSSSDDGKKGSADAKPLTAAQMKAAVLEVKDLPKGFEAKKMPPDDSTAKADKAECQPILDLMSSGVPGATKGGEADFSKAEKPADPAKALEEGGAEALLKSITAVSHQVFTLPGTGAADRVKALSTAVGKCGQVTYKDFEGDKAELKITKSDAPKGAEEATAFKMAMSVAGTEFTMEMGVLVAQQGSGLTRLVMTNPADPVFGEIAGKATDKLVAAAKS